MTGEHRFALTLVGLLFALAALGFTAGIVGLGAIVVVVAFTASTTLLGTLAILIGGGDGDPPSVADRRGRAYLTPAERRAVDAERVAVARARRVLGEDET